MDCVHDMGTVLDMAQRKSLARIDDVRRRDRVEAAREVIYTNNSAVDGVAVQNLLKEDSLVPNTVSVFSVFHQTPSSTSTL
jgi:hypothetical protein